MHRAEDGAAGGGAVALLTSLCLLGAAVTLVVGLLVPPWGLTMMALSVALSGAAFGSKAMGDDRDPPARPVPVPTSGPSHWSAEWDVDPRRTPEGAALTLPVDLFDVSGRGSVTSPDQQRKEVENRVIEQAADDLRTSAGDDVVDAAGTSDTGSSQGALLPVAWGPHVQSAREGSPELQHLESAILGRVVAEGEIIRAEFRELHDRLRASLLADLNQIAGDQQRGRKGLTDDIEQLHERSTTVLNEVRQLSAEYRQARDGLAGAVRQTATWLVKSREELYERIDAMGWMAETAASARDDIQELRDDITEALALQRIDHASAVAEASAHRGTVERLSTRLDEQAGLAVEAREQQKQLHEKLEAVTRLTEEARSSWRRDLEGLREDVVQAVVDQRIEYAGAVAEASARDRATLNPLSHRVQEQSALMAEALQAQKQLHSEVASLRDEIAHVRRSTSKALRPLPSDEEPKATPGTVPQEVQSSSSGTDTRSAITRRPRGRLAEVSQSRAEGPPVKRSSAKDAAGTTRATPAAKAPAAKPGIKASAVKKAVPAKAVKAAPAKAVNKAVGAEAAANAPAGKAATKAAGAKAATKAAPAKATKAPSAKAVEKARAPKAVAGSPAAKAATKARAAKAVSGTGPGTREARRSNSDTKA